MFVFSTRTSCYSCQAQNFVCSSFLILIVHMYRIVKFVFVQHTSVLKSSTKNSLIGAQPLVWHFQTKCQCFLFRLKPLIQTGRCTEQYMYNVYRIARRVFLKMKKCICIFLVHFFLSIN